MWMIHFGFTAMTSTTSNVPQPLDREAEAHGGQFPDQDQNPGSERRLSDSRKMPGSPTLLCLHPRRSRGRMHVGEQRGTNEG